MANAPAKYYVALRVCFVLLTVFLVQSCSSTPKNTFASTFEKQPKNEQGAAIEETEGGNNESGDGSQDNQLNPLQVSSVVPPQTSSQVLQLGDTADIDVAFDNLPLVEFINHSFANILKVDFVIDPQAQLKDKTVTLALKEKVSQKKYLSIFKDLLSQYDLAMKIQNDIIFVFNTKQRRGLPDYDFGYGRDKTSVPMGSQPIFHVAPLFYIDQTSMMGFLLRLSNAGVEKLNDPNLLGLRGERQDILRSLDIINLIDIPQVMGQRIDFIQLAYIPSGEFISKVTELLNNEGVDVDSSIRFTELSRLSGIVAHSNNEVLLKRVQYWRERLDTPESTDDKQYFIYYPENMDAVSLTKVLDKLTRFSGGSNVRAEGRGSENTSVGANSPNASGSSQGESDQLRYVTDDNINAIIIYATASKYKSIVPLLKKLDVSPPQVLIEAKLIEVTLTDQFSQGVEWSLFGGGAKRDQLTKQLSSFAGGSFSYTISGIDYNLAISLLQNQDRIKVLSSPRIVVTNGKTATINVGTEIPVLATQSADVDSDRVLQSIQYRSTGVDLTVEPVVNSSNVISLKISQNVSETSENASSGIDSPLILNRSFSTTVIANSGQSLVLGGLIRENNSSKDAQVPYLGAIPLVGSLFENESKSKTRTELVVLITPRIIANSSDINEIKNLFLNELTLFGELSGNEESAK